MTRHHRTAGASFQIVEIAGKKYTLRPHRVGAYAEMEAYVISMREDPLVIAAQACTVAPENQHANIWDAAMRAAKSARIASATEMAAFENSVRGLAWKFWQCIKGDHPDIDSVDKAIKLIELAGEQRLAEIQAKVHVGSGEADLGNSSGQAEDQETEKAPLPAGQ